MGGGGFRGEVGKGRILGPFGAVGLPLGKGGLGCHDMILLGDGYKVEIPHGNSPKRAAASKGNP